LLQLDVRNFLLLSFVRVADYSIYRVFIQSTAKLHFPCLH